MNDDTNRTESDADRRVDDLDTADPAEAPAIAEKIADELARDLDNAGKSGPADPGAGS